MKLKNFNLQWALDIFGWNKSLLQYGIFSKIMPPCFPFHLASVYISGFFEIVFGFGIILQSTRKYAAWGLIFLLIAVYPANIYLHLASSAK